MGNVSGWSLAARSPPALPADLYAGRQFDLARFRPRPPYQSVIVELHRPTVRSELDRSPDGAKKDKAMEHSDASHGDYRFTVDTHLFRELGEYLVGRNSTALIELVKNAYDADATELIVSGNNLGDAKTGSITLVDNGCGMSPTVFREGFLRIASRTKAVGDRRSRLFRRQLTGAKGIGRLAAHKLARELRIVSIPDLGPNGVRAVLDWDEVEARMTLDDLHGIPVVEELPVDQALPGTSIELVRLRHHWTKFELDRFLAEVGSFQPPEALIQPLPHHVLPDQLLFERPEVRSSNLDDPGFTVLLSGEFETGDTFWPSLPDLATWILEINAAPSGIQFAISPTYRTKRVWPQATQQIFNHSYASSDLLPPFQARIVVREGRVDLPPRVIAANSGVRIYVEGFRVLPYGDSGDDWLALNQDYARRAPASLKLLHDSGLAPDHESRGEELSALSNLNYHGAIFIASGGRSPLTMLVNREGFIPDKAFEALRDVTRLGIDLTTRVRAKYREGDAQLLRDIRSRELSDRDGHEAPSQERPAASLGTLVEEASSFLSSATGSIETGDTVRTAEAVTRAESAVKKIGLIQDDLISEAIMFRVLASVGLQMATVVHELVAISAATAHLMDNIELVAKHEAKDRSHRAAQETLLASARDLKQAIDRQASYLTHLVSADARRRRSRQDIARAFDSATALLQRAADTQQVSIMNKIPEGVMTPPMFRSELVSAITNVLSNGLKAAGNGGMIVADTYETDGASVLRVQNTGVAVALEHSERWFEPFESTTTETQALLGQGMGLGLTITRRLIESYRGSVNFVEPQRDFSTALVMEFPR